MFWFHAGRTVIGVAIGSSDLGLGLSGPKSEQPLSAIAAINAAIAAAPARRARPAAWSRRRRRHFAAGRAGRDR